MSDEWRKDIPLKSFVMLIVATHRLDALLQPVDVLLEQVERPRLAAVPRERRRARRVDRVHPVLKLNLARGLKKGKNGGFSTRERGLFLRLLRRKSLGRIDEEKVESLLSKAPKSRSAGVCSRR